MFLTALAIKGAIVIVKSGAIKGMALTAAKWVGLKTAAAGTITGAASAIVPATANAVTALAMTTVVAGGIVVVEGLLSNSRKLVNSIATRDYASAALSIVEMAIELKSWNGLQDAVQDALRGTMEISVQEVVKESVRTAVSECLSVGIEASQISENKRRVIEIIKGQLISQLSDDEN